MKPSEIIYSRIFALSNTVGSTQQEYMYQNKDAMIIQFPDRFISEIMNYLDEQHALSTKETTE